jgi:hypothetical protein
MSAVFSECGKYRYVLHRSLGSVLRWHKPVTWIMLNPSTADATTDDRTIESCMRISKHNGFTHMYVVNLYAYRSTDQSVLKTVEDPIGPENNKYILDYAKKGMDVVCAWGANSFYIKRATDVVDLIKENEIIRDGKSLLCVRRSKGGCPEHPLYKSGKTDLIEWRAL